MVHTSLCKHQRLKFNEVIPGRILHVRVPGEGHCLDVLSCYQHVWRSKDTLTANKESRSLFLAKLNSSIKGLPLRNTLLILGDFNMCLRTDMRHVGPCTIQSCRLGHRGSQGLQRLLEDHNFVAANTWGVRKPATHEQGNSVSQTDYALLRSSQSRGPKKNCQPQRQFLVAQWREGNKHFPLVGKVQHSRNFSAQVSKPYDQQAMEDSYRNRTGTITEYGLRVDELIAHSEPSWASLRQAMETALTELFPRKSKRIARPESPWETRMALSNLPSTILAMSDLHKELRQRVIFRCWRSVTQHQKSARTAKHLKKERRQKAMDECMEQAEAKSHRDGSHSLYKIIRQFRSKPRERVQLRDEHGCFLSSSDEAGLLQSYSETLFGTGEDFPLTGRKGQLGISPAEVKEQLSSIKVGKAVPRGSPPVVAWRSLGPQAHQHAAAVLNREIEQGSLSTSVTSSQISWLPKPPKKPDKPESLRPIGVIAPEGKILAGALRKRLKPALQTAMQGLPQFGFVPGRGTEEAICKALSHVDEARQRAALSQRAPGRGHQGLQLKGSLTLSVDMSKAFDMVDRVRLREALEASAADPLIIEVVGLLHINALYRMTASDKAFDIATKRGIKQGCKLAPSLFAFATGLLYSQVQQHIDAATLARLLTMYADDILLQSHFDNWAELEAALELCDSLLDRLSQLAFKVNPGKSALLIRLRGGSASTARKRLFRKEHGSRYVAMPSGRLVSHKTQVPYLGIILSYFDYESLTLTHRLKASKKALSDVAHAVRNYRVLSEHRRRSIWAITAWASALYAIHVVGLSSKGLGKLESHMVYQLRFVLWSYSRDTHETNQELLRRKGLKTAQQQLQGRLLQFLKRQAKADPTLTPLYLPRARKLAD